MNLIGCAKPSSGDRHQATTSSRNSDHSPRTKLGVIGSYSLLKPIDSNTNTIPGFRSVPSSRIRVWSFTPSSQGPGKPVVQLTPEIVLRHCSGQIQRCQKAEPTEVESEDQRSRESASRRRTRSGRPSGDPQHSHPGTSRQR